MTPEEKAKRYDEIFSMAKEWYNNPNSSSIGKSYLYAVFPELKENEDERIRKWLEEHIEAMPDNSIEFKDVKRIDVLHWIEKQDEQKLDGTFVNVDDVREDFIQEVYRVLDADSTNDRANQIIDAFDNLPTVTIEQDPCEHCENVMLNCHNFPCIKKKAFEQGKTALEAINEEKVVIKKGEKPTAWSEEDNVMIRCITLDLELLKNRDDGKAGKAAYQSEIDWLKSIKDRVKTQQEWTMQDEEELQIALDTLVKAGQHSSAKWLKNVCLVPQKKWKPSDAQMIALNDVITNGHLSNANERILKGLKEQLKKLK